MERVLSDGITTYHFDFHKNLVCPKLSCQEAYYASKLATYAFGIHSSETGKGTTYIWPETVAPKHPDTLLSCLNFHLTEVEETNRTWNIFWADNTRSQNKNYSVVMYFENLVESGFRKRVDFKFYISGHSFGPVDRNAGRAESVIRSEQQIETPADYVELINNQSALTGITWIELRQHRFRCYSDWLRAKYIEHRKDVNGGHFLFSEMVHFNFGIGERVDPLDGTLKTYSHSGVVWMRKTLNPRENPVELDLRRKRGQKDLKDIPLQALNNDAIELSNKKQEDLTTLSKYLKPNGKTYYRNIINQH